MADDKPELQEIATTTGGRDITRGFVEPLEVLQPQDPILGRRGSGDYRIYEDVLRDDQVAATFEQRRMAVVSREWEVIAGGTGRKDQMAADFLREVLDHVSFDRITDKMLFGRYYGFAVGECLWGTDGSRLMLEEVKVRKQRRFRWMGDGSLRLLTMRNPVKGEELPPRKFWTYACGGDNDDEPYGLGLAHWLYWPVFFKRNGMKFWLIFLNKFSQPTAAGHYPANATDLEKRRLLEAVNAVQVDAGLIMPEGMAIELIEAARSGTADYNALLDRMDRAITKVVLGQTMTTESGSSRAQAEVHMDVRQDLVKADADLICGSFNSTVVRWLTEWNFPGAQPPQVWRSLEDDEDLTARAKREQVIGSMGYRPTLKHVQETYGGEWEERPSGAVPAPPAEFEEGEEDDGYDLPTRYAGNVDDATGETMEAMIDHVRDLAEDCASLEELRDRLLEVYADLDPADLGAHLQRALAAAELGGRAEVLDEVGED